MSDSVYAALFHQRIDTYARILFLQRSNGEWWLPGGKKEPELGTSSQAIRHIVNNLVTYYDWHPGGIGLWHLSPEAGGGEVRLFEGYVERPDRISIKDSSCGLTQSLAWMNLWEIHDHLYKHRNIPWGQAKMAVYSLYDLWKNNRRATGELLKDDLGEVGDIIWNRPA